MWAAERRAGGRIAFPSRSRLRRVARGKGISPPCAPALGRRVLATEKLIISLRAVPFGAARLVWGGQLVQIRIFPITLRSAFWQLEAYRAPLGCLKGLVLGLTCPLCGLNRAERSILGHMEGV